MTGDIRARFGKLGNFPSPPAIAQEIIALAKNPDASVAQVAAAISKDPALVAKVLRIANSSLYAQRRQCQNVRQALTVMGVDAVMTLGLGFSITSSLRASKNSSLDYPRYWRRSLLAALAARCLGELAGYKRPRAISFLPDAEMPRTATGKNQHRELRYLRGQPDMVIMCQPSQGNGTEKSFDELRDGRVSSRAA